jgi:hypothetical protein
LSFFAKALSAAASFIPVVGPFVGPALSYIGSRKNAKAQQKFALANQDAGKLDLSYLRNQALENGFNPLTVLRATGGAGSSVSSGVPPMPSFFSGVGSFVNQSFDNVIRSNQQQSDLANLDALTGLYQAQTSESIQRQSRPMITTPSSSRSLSSTPDLSSGNITAPMYSAASGLNWGLGPRTVSPANIGDPPTGPVVNSTTPEGLEEIKDRGRTSWSLFGIDFKPFPGTSDSETLEARGAEPLSWLGGASTIVMDPLYTAAWNMGLADDDGFNLGIPNPTYYAGKVPDNLGNIPVQLPWMIAPTTSVPLGSGSGSGSGPLSPFSWRP